MTLIEFSLLTMALAVLAASVTVVVIARRLVPAIRRFDQLMRRSNRTMRRVDRTARELERMTRDARSIEGRVSRSAHGLLDQIEPMLSVAGAVLAGTRTGLGALFANGAPPRRASERHDHERST